GCVPPRAGGTRHASVRRASGLGLLRLLAPSGLRCRRGCASQHRGYVSHELLEAFGILERQPSDLDQSLGLLRQGQPTRVGGRGRLIARHGDDVRSQKWEGLKQTGDHPVVVLRLLDDRLGGDLLAGGLVRPEHFDHRIHIVAVYRDEEGHVLHAEPADLDGVASTEVDLLAGCWVIAECHRVLPGCWWRGGAAGYCVTGWPLMYIASVLSSFFSTSKANPSCCHSSPDFRAKSPFGCSET